MVSKTEQLASVSATGFWWQDLHAHSIGFQQLSFSDRFRYLAAPASDRWLRSRPRTRAAATASGQSECRPSCWVGLARRVGMVNYGRQSIRWSSTVCLEMAGNPGGQGRRRVNGVQEQNWITGV